MAAFLLDKVDVRARYFWSQYETVIHLQLSFGAAFFIMLSFGVGFVPVASAQSSDVSLGASGEALHDSCHVYFEKVRSQDKKYKLVSGQLVPLYRKPDGSPDTALYEHFKRNQQLKVFAAKEELRRSESALSGCLAAALRAKNLASGQKQSLPQANRSPAKPYSPTTRTPASIPAEVFTQPTPRQSPSRTVR